MVGDLYVLQEIDLGLEATRTALSEVQERLGESEELEEARRAVEEGRLRLRECQKRQREAEWAVEEIQAKLRPLEEKLYGGTIKNPKELMGFQQDVDSLKGRQHELEDRVLETMTLAEEAEGALAEAEGRLSEVDARCREEQESLLREQDDLQEQVQELEGRRSRQETVINAEVMRQYDTLRAAHHGRAVAKVERGICQGCRITLPIHVVQRARRSDHLVRCTSCERILYLS